MGLLLSVLLSYAGSLETVEFVRHILYGILPEGDPNFEDLVQYYTDLLQRSTVRANPDDWTQESGQGYISITENEEGKLAAAAIKYYNERNADSTALLFSTKISSFGQDSVDSNSTNEHGSKRTPERYISTTKTIIPHTTQSFSVGSRNRSPTGSYENISDPTLSLGNSSECKDEDAKSESKDKLTWHYRPLSPLPQTTLPEIHFQSFEHSPPGAEREPDSPYSEEYLRSLDGVPKNKSPFQRTDRRRSFKKRNSSSSTSSRESSKASREEELRAFTSLEEAEFENLNINTYGSAPNLTTRSHSRSRSRENTKDTKPYISETWSTDASLDSVDDADNSTNLKRLKDLPKLGSFEEEKIDDAPQIDNEVNEEEVDDDLDDFWGKSDD